MATPESEEKVAPVLPTEKAVSAPQEQAMAVEESTEPAPAVAAASSPEGEEQNAPDTSAVEASLPSFKEESYFVADLKESEKKALQEFKVKIEEGIKTNAFVPKVEEAVKDSEPEKAAELVKEEEIKEATEKTDEPQAVVTETVDKTVVEETVEAPVEKDAEKVTAETPAETVVPAEAETETKEEADSTPAKVVSSEVTVTDTNLIEVVEPPSAAATTETPAIEAVEAEEISVLDEDVSLWGVPLLHSKGDPRTDVILLKFLRARDSKVNNSFSMLKNTILWRKKFGADSILEEDFGTDFDGVAFLHGVDKEGHPVSYNIFGALNDKDLYQKAFGDQSKTENFLRWRVQLLEKSIQLLNFNPGGANALIQVIDLKNSPWPAKKELRVFINQALNLLQDNYPELVVKNVLINVPWYFSALYSIISPFLTQRTKSKFILVRGGKVTEGLFKLIAPEQVPIRYGGLSRVNDGDFGVGEAPVTELLVKAGEKQTVEFEVPAAGGTVLWDLAVVGWDVSYGAEFVPNTEGGYTKIIEKTKKITSQEEPVRNAFKALEAGKVVLIIDNTSSKKKKTAVYRYLIEQPTAATELPD